jgi:hypothetical protein
VATKKWIKKHGFRPNEVHAYLWNITLEVKRVGTEMKTVLLATQPNIAKLLNTLPT